MATNFRVKIGKIGLFTFIRKSYETNYLRICLADFYQMFIIGTYLIADYGCDLFQIAPGTLPWQPILASKLAKSAYAL